jgi:hypothetical protein
MAQPAATKAVRTLVHATQLVGVDRVATALQITPRHLAHFLDGSRAMRLAQQRALALALLTLSAETPELRREAAALLGHVEAAERFNAGETERHTTPPPSHHWP